MPMSNKCILAIDLETTGLDPEYHEITEIGAVLLNNKLEEIGTIDTRCYIQYPDRALSFNKEGTVFNALQYAGLKLSDVTGNAATILRRAAHILSFLYSRLPSQPTVYLLGQQVKFDEAFLRVAFKKENYEQFWPFDRHVIATDALYFSYYLNKYKEIPPSVSLKNICKHFNVENKQAHSALSDCRATIEVFKKLQEEWK